MVLAPPPTHGPVPSPADVALDLALPGLGSAAMLALLRLGAAGNLAQYGLIAGTLALPPAALVGWQSRPFALDDYSAAASGGVLGLVIGMGIARVAFPGPDAGFAPLDAVDTNAPLRLASMALGQAVGAAGGYVAYRYFKPFLQNLDRLPEHRTDDPNNWDRWKERHHNE